MQINWVWKKTPTYSNSALVARISCKWWLGGKSLKSAEVDACWKDPPHNKNEKKFMKGALNPLIVKMTCLFSASSFYNELSPLSNHEGL